MNDSDLQEFVKAFKDFIKHSEVEEAYHIGREQFAAYEQQSKQIIYDEIEQKAAELEVTVDYYLAEFV